MGILSDKVLLITGSTRGLGHALALALATPGTALCVHGREERGEGHALVRVLQSQGVSASYLPFDVASAPATATAVDTIERTIGPITALITCASQYDVEIINDLSPHRWQEVLAATLSGTYHLCQAVIPRMRRRRSGRVITVGCVGCDRVYHATRSVAYRIAASGVLALTRAYAQLAFHDGVTVNCIAPGFLENTQGSVQPEILPAGRLTPFTEIVPAVQFLLSDKAAHISGACLNISGGYCA